MRLLKTTIGGEGMNGIILSQEEKCELKKELLDFMRRVLSDGDNRKPEEIAVLPAISKLLLNGR